MVEYIFGRHLVEAGKISAEQLSAVIEKMDSVRVKLGLIAVAEGFMSLKQAEEVNRLQATLDKRFGDIAVEKGYLTDEQVSKLLKLQGNTYLTFAQALVDGEYLTLEELDNFIEDFKKKNGYSNSEIEDIKSDVVERIVPLMIPDACKEHEAMVGVFVRTMIRLIDRHVSIGKAECVDTAQNPALAIQKMQGSGMLADYVMEGDGALLFTTSKYGQMDFDVLDEDALDSAGEILNCVNGLFASAESRDGAFWELLPQEYNVAGIELPAAKACKVPVYVGSQMFYFVATKLA